MFMGYLKFMLLVVICILNVINLFMIYYYVFYIKIYDIYYIYNSIFGQICVYFNMFYFSINDLSLVFMLLISFLYPVILILMQYDFSANQYSYFMILLCLYFMMYMFIFTIDLLLFYLMYELMIGLVFYMMYFSSNNRGSIEAILFFLGWAILGSFCLGMAVMYIIVTLNVRLFESVIYVCFTTNEQYFLRWLIFIGFGTKLAMWPFWYWLPRAHVEVSTSMSIFLSCILIKLCFYGLIRLFLIVPGDMLCWPFLFLMGIGIFDLTPRLIIQTDLKAITAYGSVLHINLLIMLFLIDTTILNNGLMFYIWGHSYATAGMFMVINLIESCAGSRLTFEVSGMYKINPVIGMVAIYAVLTFLEFPLSFFFLGELWLWLVLFELLPFTVLILMMMVLFFYIIIFFSLWWSVIFGGMTKISYYPYNTLTFEDLMLVIYVIGFQYMIGFVPNLLYIYMSI